MSYRVVDLKEELEQRGLSKSGAKKDLVERLQLYILEHETEFDDDVGEEAAEVQGGSIPPKVQIDTNLEENDIVREYMMMRQSQFKSAIEEAGQQKEEPAVVVADEDEEDIPLSRGRKDSPKKRRGRGASATSESTDAEAVADMPLSR